MQPYILWLCAAVCAAGISFTITTTSIFQWLRDAVSPMHEKLDQLIHCPWCLNHYVVLTIVFTTNLPLMQVFNIYLLDGLFTMFTLVTIGGLIHYVLLRAYEPVLKATMERKLEQLRDQRQTGTIPIKKHKHKSLKMNPFFYLLIMGLVFVIINGITISYGIYLQHHNQRRQAFILCLTVGAISLYTCLYQAVKRITN